MTTCIVVGVANAHHHTHKPEPQLVQETLGPAVVDERVVLYPASEHTRVYEAALKQP